MMQLVASGRGHSAGRPAGTDGLYLGLLAFLGFALMFALAIRNRTKPDVHRRMILFAMLPVIPPGVNRFWANALGLDDPIPTFWLYLTLWSMAAAILVHQWRRTGGSIATRNRGRVDPGAGRGARGGGRLGMVRASGRGYPRHGPLPIEPHRARKRGQRTPNPSVQWSLSSSYGSTKKQSG
jgi:hypothetical protein